MIIIKFTFQYGQIRKSNFSLKNQMELLIYIPVWLDQKERPNFHLEYLQRYLHSSMVRLERYDYDNQKEYMN